ncbi:MAG: hypothetical protein H6512_14225 [Acidimicrobiia bacterium]|nr:hypothetical protein [Acidimicrobiia bacterium]
MTTQNNIKRTLWWVLIGLLAATVAAACGGSSDTTETATANASNTTTQNGQQPTTTVDTALAGNKITGTMPQGGVVITTPPTILYDDSAAAPFWDPVPEGMDPADFSPKYLTREEITKYVALPDPDPAAWNIPENGPTPEYAARVLNYIQALRSGLAKAAADLGADNPRVRDSAVAPFRKAMIDSFLDGIDQDASDHVVFYGEWSTTTDLQVQEVQFQEVGAGATPACLCTSPRHLFARAQRNTETNG